MAPWRYGIDLSAQSVVGVDEAGRGPLAGPVVAAAVMLDPEKPIVGLDDSKQLTESVREVLYEQIYAQALFVAVKAVDAEVIDKINILQATFLAMRQAVNAAVIARTVDLVVVDGNQKIPELTVKQMAIVGGDGLVECIMAASIIAKVYRDRVMKRFDVAHPGYGFANNKGYGTAQHMLALSKLGPLITLSR